MFGSDDSPGTLRRILVDPTRRQIVGLVVRRGLWGSEFIVPAEAIMAADNEAIEVRLSQENMGRTHEGTLALGEATSAPGAIAEPHLDAHIVPIRDHHVLVGANGPLGRIERLVVLDMQEIALFVMSYGGLYKRTVSIAPAFVSSIDSEAVYVTLDQSALPSLPEYRPDRDLAGDVKRLIAQDSLLHFDIEDIAVSITAGIVQLRGYVADGRNQARAEELARGVRGIRDVENNLFTDAQLTLDIAEALARDERTHVVPAIGVRVNHGVVVLFGEASHPSVRLAAVDVAAQVAHVRTVVSQITVPGVPALEQEQRVHFPRPGQTVFARDTALGRVEQVVMTPRTRRVTDMVVRIEAPDPVILDKEPFVDEPPHRDRILIVSARTIDALTPLEIFLNVTEQSAFNSPPFTPEQYVRPASSWETPFPYQQGDVLWDLHLARAARANLDPARAGWLDEASLATADGAWIARGYSIHFSDGEDGQVDHVLLDPETGVVSHIVVRRGHFLEKYIMVPVEWIRRIANGVLFVDAGAEQLAALSAYQPLSDAELTAIVAGRLQEIEVVKQRRTRIEVAAAGGIIQLRGVVPDEADRAAAETIARSTRGVWEVDNLLTGDVSVR